MKKIGILGGTFNPPHIGHLMMANEARHALQLDEVRFMPNAIPPHKKSGSATNAQREVMVRLAIEDSPFTIEMYELQHGGTSYTYDTMAALTAREPEAKFYFIIGGDSIDALATWYRIDDLLELVEFIGLRRPGSKAQSQYPILMVDAPQIDLSSTLLRARFATGQTVKYLVPQSIEAYIRKEGLYGA